MYMLLCIDSYVNCYVTLQNVIVKSLLIAYQEEKSNLCEIL